MENFKLVEVLLNLIYVPHQHTGEIINELLLHEIEKWGLNEKIVAISTDNGSNMAKSIRLLGEVIEIGRIPCAAHMLQLSVKKRLKQMIILNFNRIFF